MNDTGLENQRTGLREVFDILVKTPSERLRSLTFQLGESPEDTLVHALCLTILQSPDRALEKLRTLQDDPLANHLAEKWQSGEGQLDDFGDHCSQFEAKTGESLTSLAKVFKVLFDQRLCDSVLRNLAYKRALSNECFKTSSLGYNNFREEAKAVCGPQFAEWMCSSSDLKSEFSLDPNRYLREENATLKFAVSEDESAKAQCLPSPLVDSPSELSYPSHLEISLPPTDSFKGDKAFTETSGNQILIAPSIHPVSGSQTENVQSTVPQHTPAGRSQFGGENEIKTDEASMNTFQSTKSATYPYKANSGTKATQLASQSILPNISGLKSPSESKETKEEEEEEEEEEIFYAFVILHAPEDSDVADSMKEKLEAAIGTTGATFSDEFAVPGKSTLRCVQDAVNNSAFTILLLTRNFNSQMLEMKTNIALINSIHNEHKFNTVIPLLPMDNCMPRRSIPIALQTLVPLEEKRNFEKKLQKVFNRANIERQRKIWTEELKIRKLKQEKERLRLHMEQRLVLGASVQREQDGGVWWPQHSNIHIENANYVMIGNDSTMTVGRGGSEDQD
ncbi:PREDICTED: TIR domain-containing adapter molecule 1-like [Cyprinodon variegatus]|uniref:TIR domain-containing adapter molecule 1-like n=1 Tax=Cyprinodon variegatus TaxID=28743 RepID=A0A3Q2CH65_CYPVA|nr:PREDICTED: TIR domain-containing adapter molecule 1-like [Cyprinodon variegatus]